MSKNIKIKPAIVIIAYNRAESLVRLLYSLTQSTISNDTALIISIDHGGGEDVRRIAEKYEWKNGSKEIILQEKNLGLKKHVMLCGDLSVKYGSVILLEDDLFVSSMFYQYTCDALTFYKDSNEIAGISLFNHVFNQTAMLPFLPVDDGYDVYFMQIPSSWGQAWTADQWTGFKNWLDENKKIRCDEILPHDVLTWSEQSWKKNYYFYLIDVNKYFVYPRISLTTNFMDVGEHHKVKDSYLQSPLNLDKSEYKFGQMIDSKAVYDGWCENVKLLSFHTDFSDFDLVVDLYGEKKLSSFASNQYLLSTKKCRNPIKSYALEIKPHELNVVHNISGNDISFGMVNDFEELRLDALDKLNYYFGVPRYKCLKYLYFRKKKKLRLFNYFLKKINNILNLF